MPSATSTEPLKDDERKSGKKESAKDKNLKNHISHKYAKEKDVREKVWSRKLKLVYAFLAAQCKPIKLKKQPQKLLFYTFKSDDGNPSIRKCIEVERICKLDKLKEKPSLKTTTSASSTGQPVFSFEPSLEQFRMFHHLPRSKSFLVLARVVHSPTYELKGEGSISLCCKELNQLSPFQSSFHCSETLELQSSL